MKIEINGLKFEVSDTSKIFLKKYLERIKLFIKNNNIDSDVFDDIEERIAEKFSNKLAKVKIKKISDKVVIDVINEIGEPNEILEELNDNDYHANKLESIKKSFKDYFSNENEELTRNSEKGILFGVCYGIGERYSVDPLWIRLAFIFGTILWGMTFVLYIVLIFLLPNNINSKKKVKKIVKNTNIPLNSTKIKEINEKSNKKRNLFKSFFISIGRLIGFIFKLIWIFIKLFWYIFQRIFLLSFIFILFILFAWWVSQTPSLYRDWATTESVLSEITFSGNIIDVKNVRNFDHTSKTEYTPGYYDEKYNLDEVESLYYIIEPFSDYDGPAHTMLSFGFADGKYVTISAELRKEKGEGFDPFLGLMNQFEIVYIVGDENDLIKLRANVRKDTVRLYPMNASKEQIQQLFSSVLHRADKLSKEPEFYNTFWNTCTTSILKHVNTLRDNKISGFDIKILLPLNSDKIGFDLGLIDTKLSLEEAREYYKINSLSERYGNDENYSEKIRVQKK